MKFDKQLIVITCVALLTSACTAKRGEVDRQIGIKVTQNNSIPKGFNTYTFFLSPSLEYASKNTAKTVDQLGKYFTNFGKSIGPNNVAIFPTNITGRIDVYRSKSLTDEISKIYPNLSLSYNNGPYVVVLNHHPDDFDSKNRAAVSISFQSIAPDRIIEGLNYIEEGIRRKQVFQRNHKFYEAWLEVKSWLGTVDNDEVKNFVLEIIKAAG